MGIGSYVSPSMNTAAIETSAGVFRAHFTEQGLARLDLPRSKAVSSSSIENACPKDLDCWVRITVRAVRQALKGRQPARLPPLDLTRGTAFQQEVWQFLLTIPPGETRSYGEVATALERPGAARAIGQACGANPIPLLIPCHRVLAADGKRGGFSSGLAWKRWLLEREGISLSSRPLEDSELNLRSPTLKHPPPNRPSIAPMHGPTHQIPPRLKSPQNTANARSQPSL
jgi:O-6-methylguanine DNA methyltransferase